MSGARWGAGFNAVGRFVEEIEAGAAGTGRLRPGYVLAGDEVYLGDRCRAAVLKAFVPAELRDFCLSDLDLANTSIFEVLDRAQTPSLMAPFQVIYVRNVRVLYSRGAKKEEFAALDRYFRSRIRRRCLSLSPTTCVLPVTSGECRWTTRRVSNGSPRRWVSTAGWWNWRA